MDLHSGLPYWIVRNSLLDYFHPLEDDVSTAIVIVGAVITCVVLATELVRAEIRCCVIDKRSIGTESPGESPLLLQKEKVVPLCRMEKISREESEATAYHACLQSISDIKKVLKETGVDAGFEQLSSIFYASSSADNKLLEQEYEIRQKHELPVNLLKKQEIRKRYKVKVPGNALVNETSAQMDAYRAATGLLTYHMKENGLKVFTHTNIKKCTETSDGCIMITDKGNKIKCGYAIVATGFEAGQFLPQKIMDLTSTYALISHPVAPEYLWPEHCLIWETADPYLYIRTTDGNRIIVGGEDEKFSDPEHRDSLLRKKIRILERKIRKLFPDIPFKTEMAWCGTFSSTKDGLPFIGNWPGKERIFFDLGYGGNGITFSMIGAQIICHKLQDIKDERSHVFGYDRIEKYW